MPVNCISLPISLVSMRRRHLPPLSRSCAQPNGSSMPRSPSPVPSRSWPISRGTLIASRSPNSRLLDLDETHVTFRWKDYRESGDHQSKVMRITIAEFIRRFLLHVLPNRFHRIRNYGLLIPLPDQNDLTM